MTTDGKILQIIPADGWFSSCKLDDGTLWNTPLACWALIENKDGTREVRGLEAHGYVDDAEGDLRDLFWRMGMSPAEIEVQLANPYAKAYTKVFLEMFNRKVAERLAQGLIKKLFPEINVN